MSYGSAPRSSSSLIQRFRVRLARRVLFSFAGGADERRVLRVARHVEVVDVGAVVQEEARDRPTPLAIVAGCVKRV